MSIKNLNNTNMKKKEYLVPNLEVVELKFEGMLANSPEFKPEGSEEENKEPLGTKQMNSFKDFTWE